MDENLKVPKPPGYLRIIFDAVLQFLKSVGIALIPLVILAAICVPILALICKLIYKEFLYFWQIIPG